MTCARAHRCFAVFSQGWNVDLGRAQLSLVAYEMRIADAAANVLADDAHREKEYVAGHMGCIHDHEGNGGQRRAVLPLSRRAEEVVEVEDEQLLALPARC